MTGAPTLPTAADRPRDRWTPARSAGRPRARPSGTRAPIARAGGLQAWLSSAWRTPRLLFAWFRGRVVLDGKGFGGRGSLDGGVPHDLDAVVAVRNLRDEHVIDDLGRHVELAVVHGHRRLARRILVDESHLDRQAPSLIQPEVPVDGRLLVRDVIGLHVSDRLHVYPATLRFRGYQRIVGGGVKEIRRRHLDRVFRRQVVQGFVERRGHWTAGPDLLVVRHHRQVLAVVPSGNIAGTLGGEGDRIRPANHHPAGHL